MNAPAARILLVDDDVALRMMTAETLEAAGYAVRQANDGVEGFESAHADPPDLIVSDVDMPRMNGIELVRRLRADPSTLLVPVILLTGSADRQTRLTGIQLGIDEFVSKPLEFDELLARVENKLNRTRTQQDSNPLTRLPGNHAIQRRIEAALAASEAGAVLYVDLNNFKAYNDVYGFTAGDQALLGAARALAAAVHGLGGGDFVGHVGGDDFVVVGLKDRAEALCRSIIEKFDSFAPSLYRDEDRKRGFIVAKGRDGAEQRFPLLGLAIGVVFVGAGRALSPLQVGELGAELKKKAKASPASRFALEDGAQTPR